MSVRLLFSKTIKQLCLRPNQQILNFRAPTRYVELHSITYNVSGITVTVCVFPLCICYSKGIICNLFFCIHCNLLVFLILHTQHTSESMFIMSYHMIFPDLNFFFIVLTHCSFPENIWSLIN